MRLGITKQRRDQKDSRVQRAVCAAIESLEQRQMLSASAAPAGANELMTPLYHVSASPKDGTTATGFSPMQMRGAYGIGQYQASNVVFGAAQADGSGQTIAIVDAYDLPTAASDLAAFSTHFNLPQFNSGAGSPTFTVVGQDGSSTLPTTDPGPKGDDWEVEESLDIEWAHVMAPKANIVLVEANDNSGDNLYAADVTAGGLPGVSVVSNSWGGDEFNGESAYNGTFAHAGVTFLFSTGDSQTLSYPAAASNVIAVGGTNVVVDGSNNYVSEAAWDDGGGGVSLYEAQPSFQAAVAHPFSTTNRTAPDVSMSGGPDSAVSVYDSYDYGAGTPWVSVWGTSLSCPMWGGLIAVANQGRAAAGLASFSSTTQTLTSLYNLPGSDFNDITTGNNGHAAGLGYDLATGIGTPRANNLIADLTGTSDDLAVSVTAPAAANAGTNFTYTIKVTNNGTDADPTGFRVTDTLPAGVTILSGGTSPGNIGSGQNVIYDSTVPLAAGSSVSYTVHVSVPSGTADGTSLNDSASVVTHGTADANIGNNGAGAVTNVSASADLAISLDGPATTIAGDPAGFDYAITVLNKGPSDNNGFTVTDTLPIGETFQAAGSSSDVSASGQTITYTRPSGLANGISVIITVHVTTDSSLAFNSTLADTATVASTGTLDPKIPNNTATANTKVKTQADLSITKSTLATAVAGQDLTYTIVVQNAGPSDAVGAKVVDQIPANITNMSYTATQTGGATGFSNSGTGKISDSDNLPAGATITYLFTGTVGAAFAGTLSNTATVAVPAKEIDPDTTNNSATATTAIVPAALEPDPVGPGTALFIGNGQGAHTIDISGLAKPPAIQVVIGTATKTQYTQTFSTANLDRVVVYAAGGHDQVHVESSVAVPSMVFASGGNNSIVSNSASNDVLVTSGGHNFIQAGAGNSILIGGTAGNDTLRGYNAAPPVGLGQDLFIAGGTAYDNNLAALFAISSEWGSGGSVASRRSALATGGAGTLNGVYVLNSTTVTRDAAPDSLSMITASNLVFAHTTGAGVKDSISAQTAPVIVQT